MRQFGGKRRDMSYGPTPSGLGRPQCAALGQRQGVTNPLALPALRQAVATLPIRLGAKGREAHPVGQSPGASPERGAKKCLP